MLNRERTTKKPVNLSVNEALVNESRAHCGNLSAQVEEILKDHVTSERQLRQQQCQHAQQTVVIWNALHESVGSYADAHSSL